MAMWDDVSGSGVDATIDDTQRTCFSETVESGLSAQRAWRSPAWRRGFIRVLRLFHTPMTPSR